MAGRSRAVKRLAMYAPRLYKKALERALREVLIADVVRAYGWIWLFAAWCPLCCVCGTAMLYTYRHAAAEERKRYAEVFALWRRTEIEHSEEMAAAAWEKEPAENRKGRLMLLHRRRAHRKYHRFLKKKVCANDAEQEARRQQEE